MSHLVTQKPKLLARVRRLRGQLDAVERALEADIGCADVLMLVASMRGAINGLTAELMEEHLREHVLSAPDDAARATGVAELGEVIRTYLK
ncbi:metal/formaldehyde-sensitive transcriptional repressor [Mesorhizobium sp. BAC0120]|uniref:metal/formaldehyde-sensitive transcriptional repressor n=1 Tax=Mesorhizobium sp. BAC0120 TaxID=3090670 RepID=UPI00298C1DDF|nr:metal/formaldehyde-sensitive transcriptional repressor [Mesorhizobium sp. BAC0120]MDW6021808.1 metal/formaldehyde-sensitive transcriptional repressor [Mesorhizobium sp. BAC0120]